MKCKQAVDLLDNYMDGQLEMELANSLKQHLCECINCRKEYEERKELFSLFDRMAGMKAPEGLSESIMEAVFKMEVVHKQKVSRKNSVAYPVFRRLGVSMLLTAGIMIFSMFIPPQFGGAIQSLAAERTNAITDKTNKLTNTISDVDKNIKLFFENITNTFDQIKEVNIL